MPEPVFIKGYLRAYAKLLELNPENYIALFNQYYIQEIKTEPLLWQSSRQSNKAEHTLRWVTASFALVVFIAVMIWWYNTNEQDVIFPTPDNQVSQVSTDTSASDLLLTPAANVTIPLDIQSE
jgi:cytoskeleton protein RodZ